MSHHKPKHNGHVLCMRTQEKINTAKETESMKSAKPSKINAGLESVKSAATKAGKTVSSVAGNTVAQTIKGSGYLFGSFAGGVVKGFVDAKGVK